MAMTCGEPAGIGPDLAVYWAQQPHKQAMIIVADATLLAERAKQLALPLQLIHASEIEDIATLQKTLSEPSTLVVKHIPLGAPCVPGKLNVQNASYVLSCLDEAIQGCLENSYSAMVTGPLQKSVINDARIATQGGAAEHFQGHTEYLQEACHCDQVVMMLASERMRVALVSTHLPLKDVCQSITSEKVERVLKILIADLQSKFGITKPRILVAGLNPHAGENGHLGDEEITQIIPAMEKISATEATLVGPLPADTLFTPKYLDEADAVLAMYHDQGLPVLKYDSFGQGINITLGLPIIRTSVDHGTALDLAGTGKADPGSLYCAIERAHEIALANA